MRQTYYNNIDFVLLLKILNGFNNNKQIYIFHLMKIISQ